jgi:hypothetical protein
MPQMFGPWTGLLHALTLYWVETKVDVLVVRQRYREALAAIDELPLAEFERADWDAWRLQLHHLAGDDQWVVDNAKSTIEKIAGDNRLSSRVRDYLRAFVSLAARLSLGNLVGDQSKASRIFPTVAFDAARVPKKWRARFPMTVSGR